MGTVTLDVTPPTNTAQLAIPDQNDDFRSATVTVSPVAPVTAFPHT